MYFSLSLRQLFNKIEIDLVLVITELIWTLPMSHGKQYSFMRLTILLKQNISAKYTKIIFNKRIHAGVNVLNVYLYVEFTFTLIFYHSL